MQRILQELGGVLEHAKQLVADYQKDHGAVKEYDRVLKAKDAKLQEREKSVSEREAKVGDIEYSTRLRVDAEKILADAKDRLAAAAEEEAKLKGSIKDQMEELATRRSEIAQESANVEKNRKAIDQEVEKRVNECLEKMNIKKD